jgi:outer membrane protein assembly factor BamB
MTDTKRSASRGACAGIIVVLAALAAPQASLGALQRGTQAREEGSHSWPCWRGVDGSGYAPGCPPLVDDLSKAKLVWESEEKRMPSSYGFIMGGAGGPVVADGRVYIFYMWPSGEIDQAYYEKNKSTDGKKQPELEKMAKAFGMTPEEVLKTKCMKGADDIVLAMDAATGRTIWKQVFAGATQNVSMSVRGAWKWNKCGPHNIPAVAYGKVCAIGGSGMVYCLDAGTGKEAWKKQLVSLKPGARNNGAVSFAGGLFVMAKGSAAIGVNPADGSVKWEVPDCLGGVLNPVRWLPKEGGEFIVAGATAIDPATGKALWKAEGAIPGNCTAVAVNGEYLVLGGSEDKGQGVGLQCYRITPRGATKVWALPAECATQNSCAPVIAGDYAYCKNADPATPNLSRWLCVELATGKMKPTPCTRTDACASLIGGGGMLYYEAIVINADPAKLTLSTSGNWAPGDGADNYARSHTPCIVDGLLYVRGQNSVRCFDLRR